MMKKLTEKEFTSYLSTYGTSKVRDIAEEFKCSESHVHDVSKRLHAAGVIGIQKLPTTVKRKDGKQFTSNRLFAFNLIPPPSKPTEAPKLTVEGSFDPNATQGELRFKMPSVRPEDLSTEELVKLLHAKPAEELNKTGVILPTKPDWAADLWHEAHGAYLSMEDRAEGEKAAIEKIRSFIMDAFGDVLKGVL